MSGFAMFSLKDSYLIAFDGKQSGNRNLKLIYHIENIPSVTQMRVILDEIDPVDLEPIFNDIFRKLQHGNFLEPMVFMDGCYLLSIGGTGDSSSNKSCSDSGCKKNEKFTSPHQMLSAIIVHPELRKVIPLAPEQIFKNGNC